MCLYNFIGKTIYYYCYVSQRGSFSWIRIFFRPKVGRQVLSFFLPDGRMFSLLIGCRWSENSKYCVVQFSVTRGTRSKRLWRHQFLQCSQWERTNKFHFDICIDRYTCDSLVVFWQFHRLRHKRLNVVNKRLDLRERFSKSDCLCIFVVQVCLRFSMSEWFTCPGVGSCQVRRSVSFQVSLWSSSVLYDSVRHRF